MSTILHHTHTFDCVDDDMLAIADVMCIGFFFLRRPGEHSLSAKNTPFCLQNMTLHQGANTMTHETAGTVESDNATLVALTFITQKNGVKGKIICNGMARDLHTCPARAVVRHPQHHKQHNS